MEPVQQKKVPMKFLVVIIVLAIFVLAIIIISFVMSSKRAREDASSNKKNEVVIRNPSISPTPNITQFMKQKKEGWIEFTGQRFSITYPEIWEPYINPIVEGEEIILRPRQRTVTEPPVEIIIDVIPQEKAQEQGAILSGFGFTGELTKLGNYSVEKWSGQSEFGTANGWFRDGPLQETYYIIDKSGYSAVVGYKYNATAVYPPLEEKLSEIVETFRFIQ